MEGKWNIEKHLLQKGELDKSISKIIKEKYDEKIDLSAEIHRKMFRGQVLNGPISGPNPNPKQNHWKIGTDCLNYTVITSSGCIKTVTDSYQSVCEPFPGTSEEI